MKAVELPLEGETAVHQEQLEDPPEQTLVPFHPAYDVEVEFDVANRC
jgi:hypothetical protein